MGELELDRGNPVFLGGPDLHLGSRPGELHLPDPAYVAAGTLDTSFVSSDYINNPRTMNAVYALGPRLAAAKRFGKERLEGEELKNRQLPDFFQTPNVWTPHVLKDGADSVGALGALNRVYLNIGLFSEEWLLHFRPLRAASQSLRSASRRAEEFGVLASDRAAKRGSCFVPHCSERAASSRRCARRRGLSDQ